MVTGKKLYSTLEIPFLWEGNLITDFTPREMTFDELDEIQDLQLKRSNPVDWIAKVICYSVANMGGVDVYNEYSQDKSNYPDIVLAIPLVSTNNILLSGHINTLDHKLLDLPIQCNRCGFENDLDIDLLDIGHTSKDLENLKSTEDIEVDVKLVKGITLSSQASDNIGLPKGAIFKHLKLRIPTLGDTLILGKFYSFTDPKFTRGLMGQCLLNLSTDEGVEIPENMLKIKGKNLLLNIAPKDYQVIVRAQNKALPDLNLESTKSCKKCRQSIGVKIDSSFLFSLA